MEPGPLWAGLVLGVPAFASALIVALLSQPWSSPSRFRLELGWILALVIATITGVCAGKYWPSDVLHETGPLLVFVLPALGITSIIFASPAVPRRIAWGLRAAVLIAMSPMMLSFMWRNETWNWPWETLAWLAGLGTAATLVTFWTSVLAQRSPGRSIPFAIGLLCAFTGATIVMSGGISVGSMALSLGAAIAGGLFASINISKVISCRGCVGVSIAILMAILIFARFTQIDTPPLSLYLLASAPLTLWIGEIPAVSRLKGWQIVALRMVAILIPLTIAVTPVAIDFARAYGEGKF